MFTESGIFTYDVNDRKTVNIRGNLGARTAGILRGVPGVEVVFEAASQGPPGDAEVVYADQQATVKVEAKQRVNAAAAWHLVHQVKSSPERPLLLVASTTTAKAREILTDNGISVVDGQGYAHIELPPLLVHVQSDRRKESPSKTSPPTKLRGKAGLAAQALLLHPEREWTIQALSAKAGIAASFAHRVFSRLEEEGVVRAEGRGPSKFRKVVDPTALFDLWSEEQEPPSTRTPAYMLAQGPRQLLENLAQSFSDYEMDYAITGPAAASVLAPFATAIPVVEVWVPARAGSKELHTAAGAEQVAQGHNVIFLQGPDDTPLAFREEVDGTSLANRFRLHSDLLTNPRRGREQADRLREEVIGF